jgi:hypothetical protein
VPDRVLLHGDGKELESAKAALAARGDALPVIPVHGTGDLAGQARKGGFSVAVILPGPIAEHDRRVGAVSTLRREGFRGRLLFAGAFLTEKEAALAAGADFVFDARVWPLDLVVSKALRRPIVAVDHPYLRFLLSEEWATIERYSETLPRAAPPVLLASVSAHGDPAFWDALADYAAANPGTRCIVVEDDDDPETCAAVMACGVQPYVSLADRGLLYLHALVRRVLHEIWLGAMLAS